MKDIFIIIIDDSPTVCENLEQVLQKQGYKVKSFHDPQQALSALLIKEQIRLSDLLIVDLLLPEITGLEVIKRFREHPEYKEKPIIALSRLDGLLDRLQARLAGADAYMTKPFTEAQILALIEHFVSGMSRSRK